jgi:hypothetical protein
LDELPVGILQILLPKFSNVVNIDVNERTFLKKIEKFIKKRDQFESKTNGKGERG